MSRKTICEFCNRELKELDPADKDDGHLCHWPTKKLICLECAYPELEEFPSPDEAPEPQPGSLDWNYLGFDELYVMLGGEG